jgi:DNA-binding XRE family transcriptional regulator
MSVILPPRPVATSDDTVTFSRADWSAFMEQLEDAEDLRSVQDHKAWVEQVGKAEARRLSYSAREMERMIDGVSVVTIWRERAGMTQLALAKAAEISTSYLCEIEGGKKPGSTAAMRKLAKALNVPMETLV